MPLIIHNASSVTQFEVRAGGRLDGVGHAETKVSGVRPICRPLCHA
jgi:hypothetical protein